MGVFFFRLTNWVVMIVAVGLAGGGLSHLAARYVFKRRASLPGCMLAMASATIFSFLFDFALVYALAITQTYVETWVVGVSAIVAGILGGVAAMSLLRDRLTGKRLGLARAAGMVLLSVVLPLIVIAAVLGASGG